MRTSDGGGGGDSLRGVKQATGRGRAAAAATQRDPDVVIVFAFASSSSRHRSTRRCSTLAGARARRCARRRARSRCDRRAAASLAPARARIHTFTRARPPSPSRVRHIDLSNGAHTHGARRRADPPRAVERRRASPRPVCRRRRCARRRRGARDADARGATTTWRKMLIEPRWGEQSGVCACGGDREVASIAFDSNTRAPPRGSHSIRRSALERLACLSPSAPPSPSLPPIGGWMLFGWFARASAPSRGAPATATLPLRARCTTRPRGASSGMSWSS